MSFLILNETTPPSVPAANKGAVFMDSADEKIKVLDDQGFTVVLSPDGWRDQNLLINGDCGFAQRQVPTTLTSSTALAGGRQYAFDRIFQSNAGGTQIVQTQQVSNLGGAEVGIQAETYGKFKVITAAGKLVVGQVVESVNMNHILGKRVIVQCMMKYSVAASMAMRLGLVYMTGVGTADTISAAASGFISAFGATGVDPTLTAAANLAYIAPLVAENGTITGNGVDINLTNGWVRYSASFLVPATARNIIPMVWSNANLAINDELNITEFGCYLGEERRDWNPKHQALELEDCKRYYEKSFPLLQAPAASVAVATGGTGASSIIGKAAATALAVHIPIWYTVQKRITPTVVLFTPVNAGAVPMRIDGTTPAVQTAVAQLGSTQNGLTVTATGDAAGAVGDLVGVHYTADAEI